MLATNRGHWAIKNRCHSVIECNFKGDRSRIRAGMLRKMSHGRGVLRWGDQNFHQRQDQRCRKNAPVVPKHSPGLRLPVYDQELNPNFCARLRLEQVHRAPRPRQNVRSTAPTGLVDQTHRPTDTLPNRERLGYAGTALLIAEQSATLA